MWRSVWPFDHDEAIAARIAALSLTTSIAIDATGDARDTGVRAREAVAAGELRRTATTIALAPRYPNIL